MMEDIMPMLLWLPMIILGGIWSMAVDPGSGKAERSGSSTGGVDDAASRRHS
jgi:hypothetical protein